MDPAKVLDPLFEAAVANNKYPGIAATIVDGQGNRLYHKAFGVNDISAETPESFTTATPVALWSCTKLLTSIAALQLIEQGKLGLDDAVTKYLPEVKDIEVFEGPGKTETRKQKTEMTVRHLITHTAGFTYDFFDPTTIQWRIKQGHQPANYLMDGTKKYYTTPLLFDAGTKFHYGINIDWLGFVIQSITGQRLEDYIRDNITKPLGMNTTVPYLAEDAKRLLVHVHGESGKDALSSVAPLNSPPGLEVYGGGHYAISSLDDYSTLLATILNKGTSPTTKAQILRPETVAEYMFTSQLPPQADLSDLVSIQSTVPMLTNKGQVLPGQKLGWSCGLCLNLEDIQGARKAGSGAWAGLGNLYYFIDPKSQRAAMIASSVFPFMDRGILRLFEALESVAVGDGSVREGEGLKLVKVEDP